MKNRIQKYIASLHYRENEFEDTFTYSDYRSHDDTVPQIRKYPITMAISQKKKTAQQMNDYTNVRTYTCEILAKKHLQPLDLMTYHSVEIETVFGLRNRYLPQNAARGNDTRRARAVFSFRSSFLRGSQSKSSAHRGWSPLKRHTGHTKWSISIKRHACNTPTYLHKKSTT